MFLQNVGIYLQVHAELQPTAPVLRTENGGSVFFQNVGVYFQVHTALLPKDQHRRIDHRENLKSYTVRLFAHSGELSPEDPAATCTRQSVGLPLPWDPKVCYRFHLDPPLKPFPSYFSSHPTIQVLLPFYPPIHSSAFELVNLSFHEVFDSVFVFSSPC